MNAPSEAPKEIWIVSDVAFYLLDHKRHDSNLHYILASSHEAEIARLTHQIAALQASNEAMRKDVERYKFIREISYVEIHCDSPRVTNWEGALDNSVDAAIQNQSELGK